MIFKRLAFAALLPLAACATGGVSLTQQDISAAYSPGEFARAGAGRDLRVVVVGNPFGGDQAAFEATVTDAMQGQHSGQRANFTTTPGDSARLMYRVMFVFNPPQGTGSARLCRPEAVRTQTAPAGDWTVLLGAFCREETLMTRITGRVPGAANAQDPAFRSLVGQVTNGLFPPDRDRRRNRGRCTPLMQCN